jgi:hypothetical protein
MQYNTLVLPHGQVATQPGALNLTSLLGVQIGQDLTGNFGFTPAGLAVLGRDNRYYTLDYHEDLARMLDVTSIILPINPGVYRIPVQRVYRGDLVLISDSPFSALFVTEVQEDEGSIVGIEATCNERVEYSPPYNFFGGVLFGEDAKLFVRIVSLFDLLGNLFGDHDDDER